MAKKRIIFVVLFLVLALIAKQINFSALISAENQFFTLFQFIGPIAGGFLGGLYGALAVAGAEIISFFTAGKEATLVNIIRLAPMVFAALYFGLMAKKDMLGRFLKIGVPAACITLFIMHPVGREVWFFSLYWLIPIISAIIPESWKGAILFRSYGATFTAHAVGGAAWIWSVPMTAEQWVALIPVVAFERLLFGAGIAGSYILINSLADWLTDKVKIKIPHTVLFIDKKYVLSRLFRV